jgi:hypothetical protein
VKTLKEILALKDYTAMTEIEKAIRSAFWAGQSHERGTICINLRDQVMSRRKGRYHRIEEKAIKHVLSVVGINQSFVFHNTGDSGIAEANEIFDWDFDI